MEIFPIQLFQMLITSVLLGGGLGVFCDLYRALWMLFGVKEKKQKKDGILYRIVQFLGDLLFFAMAALCITVLNYTFNDGKLRIYTFLGVFGGYLIYHFSVEKMVFFLLKKIVFIFQRVF